MAMGCCQDKVAAETPVPKTRPLQRDGPGARAARPAGDEKDARGRRDRRSEDGFLITVLWQRLSMFSRRSSARSTARHSEATQRPEDTIQEGKHEDSQGQPEKG